VENKKVISLKYAKAFLNIYLDDISLDNFNAIKKAESFFSTHKKSLYFFSIPNISSEKKENLIRKLLQKFNLLELFEPMVKTLIASKRIFLIYDMLKHITRLYKQRKNIMMFDIVSSHELDKDDLETIKTFLSKKTGKKIISKSTIDKTLIAGIKLKSSTLLWEYSIYKQCETLRSQLTL